MNQILDPLLLRDTASRGKVAVVYLGLGLLVGVFVLNSNTGS